MSTHFVPEQERMVAREQPEVAVKAAGAGAATEAIGAAAAIVLAIIGLAGALTTAMMAISTIVLGGVILSDAGAVGARYDRLVRDAWGRGSRFLRAEVGGGVSLEALAGVAGIALGILALIGLVPVVLCSVALSVFGLALISGSAAKERFASIRIAHYGLAESTRRVLDEAVEVSAGGEALVGVGALVLGILALLGVSPTTLVLVGFLGVGGAMLLSGTALSARILGVLRHELHPER